jgi:hypothetical protein
MFFRTFANPHRPRFKILRFRIMEVLFLGGVYITHTSPNIAQEFRKMAFLKRKGISCFVAM